MNFRTLPIFLSTVLCWLSFHLYAYSNTLKPEINPVKVFHLLEDPAKSYTLNELLSAKGPNFSEGGDFNENVMTYWVKFELYNPTEINEWLVEFPNWLYVDAYLLREEPEPLEKKQTGAWISYLERDFPMVNKNLVSLKINPRDKLTVYARLEAGMDDIVLPENIEIIVGPEKKFVSNYHYESKVLSLFAGILLALFCYNFFIYFSVKEHEFLYYLAILLISIFAIPFNFGYLTVVFQNVQGYPFWAGKIDNILSSVYGIMIIFFTLEFLKTKKYFPILYKVLLGFVFFLLIIPVPSFFGMTFLSFNLSSLTGLALFVVIMAVAIKSWIRKIPSSSYFLLAFSFFIFGLTIFLMKELSILPNNSFTAYSMKMGTSLKAIFFSFAMANKINILKKENMLKQEQIIQQLEINQELQTKVNRELEQKVSERTTEIKEKNEELMQLAEEIASQRDALEVQKEKVEKLLLNILPKEVTLELEEKGIATPKFYKSATVLFTDFKDFTALTENMDPVVLLEDLNYCFVSFDRIIIKYGLEKIKTIGDSYMCAGGIPVSDEQHASKCVKAALEIISFIDNWNKIKKSKGENAWEVRIGINSGPLTTGVVGETKFAYDVWGDTVNIASRMESSGTDGKINISGSTYELIKGEFECSYRGKVQAKNKGELDMYFVEGIKEPEPVSI